MIVAWLLLWAVQVVAQTFRFDGSVTDPQGKVAAGAVVFLEKESQQVARSRTDDAGQFTFSGVTPGVYLLRAELHGFADISRKILVPGAKGQQLGLQFGHLAEQHEAMVITAKSLEPSADLRNEEVFNRTLFTRDDQVLQQLNAGINAGQNEGGGKSLEIRRFGFNLDHGGVNGGRTEGSGR